MQATAAPTLYQRLGGYDVVAAFTDQWLGLVLGDPLLAPYFDMKTLHEGLGISREEYDALLQHATTTLDTLGVGEGEKIELLAWMASLEDDTIERS